MLLLFGKEIGIVEQWFQHSGGAHDSRTRKQHFGCLPRSGFGYRRKRFFRHGRIIEERLEEGRPAIPWHKKVVQNFVRNVRVSQSLRKSGFIKCGQRHAGLLTKDGVLAQVDEYFEHLSGRNGEGSAGGRSHYARRDSRLLHHLDQSSHQELARAGFAPHQEISADEESQISVEHPVWIADFYL